MAFLLAYSLKRLLKLEMCHNWGRLTWRNFYPDVLANVYIRRDRGLYRVRKLCWALITVLVAVIIGCGTNGKLTGTREDSLTEMERFTERTGFSDIEWVNVVYRKEEPGKNYPVTVSVTKQDNPELIDIFERALAQGSYQQAPMPQIKGTTNLAIKLANGKYIQTPYSGQIFVHPKSDLAEYAGTTGVLITPSKEFDGLVNKLVANEIKINTSARGGKTGAVIIIRNKNIELARVNLSAYSDDPDFKGFSLVQGQSLQDYEAETLQQAEKMGIDPEELRGALDAAKNKIGRSINKIPIIIETVRYQGKESFLFAYAWEYLPKVESLGHIWVLVIEKGSNQVLFSDHCM